MTDSPQTSFLAGGGTMGARMRAFDWESTSLGPALRWPQSLKTIVRVLLDSRYAMWMLWGPDLTFFCNDAYLPTVGLKRDWVLGARADRVWEEIWPEIAPRIERVLRDGEASWDEQLPLFLHRHGYMEETYHTFSYSPIYDDASRIAGMLCVVTETTAQVIEARRLRLLREIGIASLRAKGTAEVCRSILTVLERDSEDIPFAALYRWTADAAGAERLGYTETMAEPIANVIVPPTMALDAGLWPLEQTRQGLPVLVGDLRARFGAVSAGPWSDPIGEALVLPLRGGGQTAPAGFLVAGISSRRALDDNYRAFFDLAAAQIAAALADADAYEAEQRRAEALAELSRAKSTFFSNVSHEFRTPLTLILGPSQEILEDVSAPALVRERAGLIHSNALRMLKLVNSLLDFSRVEAGQMNAVFEAVDLGALTRGIADTFSVAMHKAGLEFRVECEDLDTPVYIDPVIWEQIVLNLLANAFKYTLRGSVSLTVRREGERAIFEVLDTGVGIAESELPHIFKRFHRVEGAEARTSEGSGIGLSLVHELVQLQRGTIEVTSQLGKGSRFAVSMPLGADHLPADPKIGPARRPPPEGAAAFVLEALRSLSTEDLHEVTTAPPVTVSPTGDRRFASTLGARILIAEDNPDMRRHLRAILGSHYEIELAQDGHDALESLRRSPADLLLTDVMMPRLDGFGLLREIRADESLREIPVILLSARAGEEARIEGLDAGADDYLIKPFSARELLARVGALIELVRMRRAWSTREREVADRLRASERRLRLAQRAAGSADFEWDPVTHAAVWSEATFEFFAIDPKDPDPNSTLLKSVHAEDRPLLYTAMADVQRDGGTVDFEFRYAHPKRGERWIRSHAGLFEDGERVAIVGLSFDVTERRRAQEEREQLLSAERAARSEAERATQFKDEFLATLSHELRSPLSVIVSWSRILQQKFGNSDQQLAQGLRLIARNALVQSQLISDLLDMSRITSGKLALAIQPIELNELLRDATEAHRPTADAKGIALHFEVAPQPVLASGDPTRLNQVIWNLLTNAIKFTPQGGKVEVRVTRSNDRAGFSVADTGEGIAPAFLEHLFGRFRQAESGAGRRHGGLGLGLAIAKQIVDLHGGEIEATSPGVGQGATFSVSLPAFGLASVESSSPWSEPAEAEALRGLTVLAVEDERDMREYLRRVLEEQGARVIEAADGAQALAAVRRATATGEIDVLISDIGMPGMDGYQLIREIRHSLAIPPERLPAVAVTAFARAEDAARALAVGFQGHLSKPYQVSQIVAVIRGVREGQVPEPRRP